MTRIDDIPAILDELEAIYNSSVANLRAALNAYARQGIRPDRKARDEGAFAYPELRIEYDPDTPPPIPARAFARLNQPGSLYHLDRPARPVPRISRATSSSIWSAIILSMSRSAVRRAKSPTLM